MSWPSSYLSLRVSSILVLIARTLIMPVRAMNFRSCLGQQSFPVIESEVQGLSDSSFKVLRATECNRESIIACLAEVSPLPQSQWLGGLMGGFVHGCQHAY